MTSQFPHVHLSSQRVSVQQESFLFVPFSHAVKGIFPFFVSSLFKSKPQGDSVQVKQYDHQLCIPLLRRREPRLGPWLRPGSSIAKTLPA